MRAQLSIVLFAASCMVTGCDSGDTPTEANEPGFAIDQELSPNPNNGSDPANTPGNGDPATQPGNNDPGSGNGGTNPPATNPPADAGLSCQDIYQGVGACYQTYYDCAGPCQDQACADACEETYWGCFDAEVAKGSTQGQTEFNSVRACEDQHYQACYDKGGVVYNECAEQCSDEACSKACADEANGVLSGCMEESCSAELTQCGLLENAPSQEPSTDPSQDPAPETDNGLTCKGIYEAVGSCYDAYYECASPCQDQACADACEETYWGCFDAKVAEGNAQGQTEFKALRDCEDTHYQDCYDEGAVVFNDCSSSCSDEACTNACADQANAVLKECMVSNCQAEFDVCGVFDENAPSGNGGGNEGGNGETPEAPPGELSCGELYTCEDACNGNQNCGQACYDSGSATAQSQWTDLIKCGQIFCDGQVFDSASYKSCLQQMCSPEYGVCFSPNGGGGNNGGDGNNGGNAPGQGAGAGTCGEGLNCIKTCYAASNSEQAFYACVDTCYANMSAAANTLIDSLAACADTQCANVPGSIDNYFKCQQDFCTNEYNACVNQL